MEGAQGREGARGREGGREGKGTTVTQRNEGLVVSSKLGVPVQYSE